MFFFSAWCGDPQETRVLYIFLSPLIISFTSSLKIILKLLKYLIPLLYNKLLSSILDFTIKTFFYFLQHMDMFTTNNSSYSHPFSPNCSESSLQNSEGSQGMLKGFKRGFSKFYNPLSGTNPIETDLD